MRPPRLVPLLLALPLALLAPQVAPARPAAKSPAAKPLRLGAVTEVSERPGRKALVPVRFKSIGKRRGWVVRVPRDHPEPPMALSEAFDRRREPSNVPSPAVLRGHVLVSTTFQDHKVHAFQARGGQHAWTQRLGDNGPSAFVVDGRYGYTNTESCTTYAITPRTGTVVWSRDLGPTVQAIPSIVGDTLFAVHRLGRHEMAISALRAADGEVLWQQPLIADIRGAPVHQAGQLYLTLRSGSLTAMSEEGVTRWTANAQASSAPWVDGEQLYVAEEAAWRIGPPVVRCVATATGRTLWRTDPYVAEGPEPRAERWPSHNAISGSLGGWASDAPRPYVMGKRVVIAGGRDLLVLDKLSGTIERRWRLPEGRRFHAPPAFLGKTLLFVTYEGLLLEIEPRAGLVTFAYDLGTRATSQPVVHDGWAYVTADDLLFGVPLHDGLADASWPQWGGSASHAADAPTVTPRGRTRRR